MARYVMLYKFTQQGAKTPETLPQRVREAMTRAEQGGVKVLDWYLTMGQYDVVTILEAPDDETVAAGALGVARAGNVSTETLRAFTQQEMEQLVQRLG